ALADRLGEVLAVLPPQRAAQERRIAVHPLLGLLVEGPVIAGDGERRDGDLLLGVPQLGIGRELTDERDAVVRSHVNSSFVSVTSHLLCHMAATRWPRRESPAYPTSGRGFPLVGRARSVRAGCCGRGGIDAGRGRVDRAGMDRIGHGVQLVAPGGGVD